jgi:hypothetical protein
MIVIFQGIEAHDHRAVLESIDTLFATKPRIMAGLSWSGLRRRRLTVRYVEETAAKFPVVLEAGVSTRPLKQDTARRMEEEYYEFVQSCDGITNAIQFDHPSLSDETDWVGRNDPKMIPVLRDPTPEGIAKTAKDWSRVALLMPSSSPVKAALRASGMFGVALAQPDLEAAKSAGFASVLTSAWIAPGRYGEVSLWDGNRHHRANSEHREALLRKHAKVITGYGFDLDLIAKGDARECNRLAAHGLVSWAHSLSAQADLSTNSGSAEPETPRNVLHLFTNPNPPAVTKSRRATAFPGFGTTSTVALTRDDDGREALRELPLVQSTDETVRKCASCFLAVNCPAYDPAATCAFNLPVEVRTDAQARSMLYTMVEMQAARVAFARFAEEVNGGYPDPVVGQEMDRLVSMTDKMLKQHERRERLTVSVESESSGGGTGVLSRLFGGRPQADPLPPAIVQQDEGYLPMPPE